ncbi:adhesive domain-containing protein, partial [Listeria valentina]|uniref:adhesive domain-containing protein n=1 Tax=Listeria valentina TaxID=2705293 RepID=UPI001430F0E2
MKKVSRGKQFLATLATLLLVSQSLLSPIVAQAETTQTDDNPNQNIQLASDQDEVQVGQTFDVKVTQSKGEELSMQLPEGVDYQGVQGKTEQTIQKVENEGQKLTIHWNKNVTEKEGTLTLKAAKAGKYEFTAKGTSDAGEVTSNQLSVQGFVKPQVRAGTINADIDISPANDSVSSGQDAVYELNFKATGSQTTYQNAKIVVNLPENVAFTQDVNELKIAGTAPTYDASAHTLTYQFATLAAGQANKVFVKVNTVNGTTASGTALTSKATFTADNFTGDATDEATVTVNASSSLSTSKTYSQTVDSDGKEKTTPPTAGDTGTWTIKVNADQKETGLLYFKDGSQIKVVDTIPNGLTYVSDNAGGVYDATAKTVTWTFDAPSLAEQKAATDHLFTKTIEVQTKFNANIENLATFQNKVTSTAVDINDQSISSSGSASVSAGISDPNKVPEGNVLAPPNHGGPINGLGDAGATFNHNNPDPQVYDDALLSFTITIGSSTTNSYSKDFKKYNILYDVDSHLELDALNFSGWANFKPDWSIPENGTIALKPRANIYLTVDGTERKVLSDVEYLGMKLTREDLGLTKSEHVSKIRFEHTYAPAGLYSPFAYPRFSIEKGYTGKVTNYVHYDVTGYNKAGDEVSWTNDTEVNDVNTYTGYRTATVVPKPPEANPTLSNSIRFDTQDNGVVKSGSNRVTGYLTNDATSTVSATAPLEEAVLLPKGVTVDTGNTEYQLSDGSLWDEKTPSGLDKKYGSIEIVSDNYNGTGQQLIRVKWSVDTLPSGKQLGYAFNVNIAENAPTKLVPEAYAYVGNTEFNVPSQTGNSVTNSTKEADTSDLNGDGNTSQQMIKTGNKYSLLREDKISTSKLVKGDLDSAFSKFGHASPGGTIDYQLKLTNDGDTDISSMVLMDVLPSIGDLGITDNSNRGSQFAPILTGPIEVPAVWAGKVAITYSTATNPSRADLTQNVLYPSTTTPITDPSDAQAPNWMDASAVMDWSQIHSFKVTLLDNNTWVSGEDITLDFAMKAPTDLSKDLTDASVDETTRAAWNSFAFASNNMQVVEPER